MHPLPVLLFSEQSGRRSEKLKCKLTNFFNKNYRFTAWNLNSCVENRIPASGTKTDKIKICVVNHCKISIYLKSLKK